jgi:HAD superfamily hydrolase (TIGR01458 family)
MVRTMLEDVRALLIDLDGVLYVEEKPIAGAAEAVRRLRERGLPLRFVTNTTAHSRDRTLKKLARLGLGVDGGELITPAALAVRHCRERGHHRVALIMNEEVKRDFKELQETTGRADAVIIGDLGPAFGYDVLNHAFRQVMDGAELIALQKNRYWMRADGLSLDVGPFVAAIEFAAGRDAYVVGKPAKGFFEQVLATVGVDASAAAMVGDDIESDIGGALRAGLAAILVRTGKYREDRVRESGIQPTPRRRLNRRRARATRRLSPEVHPLAEIRPPLGPTSSTSAATRPPRYPGSLPAHEHGRVDPELLLLQEAALGPN